MRQLPFARFLKPFLGLLLLAGLCWQMDGLKVLALARHADPAWLAFGFFAYVLSNLISAWRWQRIVMHFGYMRPFLAMLWLYAQGITLNTLLPGGIVGGDVWRSVQLAQQARQDNQVFGLHQTALTVLLDRVGGLWGLSIWSLLAWGLAGFFLRLPSFQPLRGLDFFNAYLGFLMIAVLLPVFGLCFMHRCIRAIRQAKTTQLCLFSSVMHKLLSHETRSRWLREDWLHQLRRLDSLWLTLPHSIAVQVFATLALWACLQALSQPLDYLCVAGLCFAIFLSAIVPASFGGFGAREVACVVILGWAGVAEEAAFSASILFGLLGLLQGLLAAIGWLRKAPEPL